MTLQQILSWLVGGGAGTVILFLVAQIPSVQKWLGQFQPKVQTVLEFVAAGVLAIAAQVGLQYIPAALFATLAPYFATLVTLFGMFFGLQLIKSGQSTNSTPPKS